MFNIQNTLKELEGYSKEQVWYIVKQEMEFWKVCYAVSILEEYQSYETQSENMEKYFKRRAVEIKSEKNFEKFITTHRMLLLGYMLGLMYRNDAQYKNATITSVFTEIKERCNGNFEDTESYYDILEKECQYEDGNER